MGSSEDENEENFELQHWNNWSEPKNELPVSESLKNNISNSYIFNNSELLTVSKVVRDPRFGCWIPPIHFICPKGTKSLLPVQSKNDIFNNDLKEIDVIIKDDCMQRQKRIINVDWGEQMELNDVTKCSDGNSIWNVVNLGLFGHIKLWVNEYNNVCVSAEGTISKLGSTEATLVCIYKAELLRKMLHLSSAQWASLCEAVVESKARLSFDAFLDFNLHNKSALDKMWFFICKRRHFLQDRCMLVKLTGAVKCMKRFEIIPKLVVQDVRNLKGEPIL